MSYLVLARKWRPQRFDEVVGQRHVTRTLANAIEQNRVAHAFIFSGVRGVGKTSLARILAKSLNCASGPTPSPCGTCDSCAAVTAGTAVDVIEIDGASNNSVEDIRNLRETVPYRPQLGRFKIYVIDEVHMLSTSAFNALLKTLEEPPPHVKFIFATTMPHKVPVTILSRCQRYDFRRIPEGAIADRIRAILKEEKIRADEAALYLIAREAEGSMRDALSILDQVLAAGASEITAEAVSELLGMVESRVFHELARAILEEQPGRAVELVREVDNQGYDIPTFAKGLLEHLGNLVVAGVCRGEKPVLDLPEEELEQLRAEAASVSSGTLHRIFKHFAESYEAIARSGHPRVLLEASVARLADLGALVDPDALIGRLEALAGRGGAETVRSGGAVQAPQKSAPAPAPAPAPAKPPVPQPAARPGPADTDIRQVIDALKSERPTLASLLEYGTVELSGGRKGQALAITFSKQNAAVASLASERAGEIAECVGARLGAPVEVEIRVDEAAPVPAATRRRIEQEDQARQREEEARQHPLVRRLKSEMGGALKGVRLQKDKGRP